jgi:predicted membrane-bound mannosyltransferase/DNA-binding beta-propeller fold protein YncE
MESKRNWLDRPIHPSLPAFTNEIAIFAVIILFAAVTRFYDLGARVMSHDESLHTYFSWLLSRGQGYQHSPMMHGPFQFHVVALSYFLFGASDFTSRIPAVLFSIATVWMVWYWRRHLGKWGALIAGFLLVISPYMLYYGRYVRNESFVGFSGMVMLYAILRHLEVGGKKYLFLLAGALALHFTSKETSFIYTAQALVYLAVYFVAQVTKQPWTNARSDYRMFIIALSVTILLAGAALGYGLYTHEERTLSGTETAMPANPTEETIPPLTAPAPAPLSPITILALASTLAFIAASFFLIRGYTWGRIRSERSFDLLIVCGTLVLPQLAPFLIKFLENTLKVVIPTTAGEVQAMSGDPRSILIIGGFLLLMFLLSALAGLLWNPEKWWKTALVFWVPFTILYTTFFTNSDGFFTGAVGSLGYWLVQQGVERGSQPWYYYLLIQIPMYEFLPALGFILALFLGARRKVEPLPEEENDEALRFLVEGEAGEQRFVNTFSLLAFWGVASVAAFSYAGERMPWLTYHMAWPLILITGWALGRIIETTDWAKIRGQNVLLTFVAAVTFVASASSALLIWNGSIRPFQGQALEQLQVTNAFLLPLIVSVASLAAAVYLLRAWTYREVGRVFILAFFGFLAVLTARASFRASYIAYDQATEFLVYAHGATGIKDVIAQAEEISKRTTGGMSVALAYDASAPDTGVSWPFVWYLRDFTNLRSFDQPTRSLRDWVVIIVDEKNFDKIEPAIGPGYYRQDYIRMWWPMQDYFALVNPRDPNVPFSEDYACSGWMSFLKLRKSRDYSRFCEGFTNRQVRAGIIQIWLNRDYTQYAQARGGRPDLNVATWSPADRMRLYIRQDVAAQIWNYGIAPSPQETIQDPTEGKYIPLAADLMLDATGANPLLLSAPRSLAFARDGTFYVADSRSHRILHLDRQGNILHQWGSFADGINIPVAPGAFNEPWGIAVGPDGSVYVTDTWNHRIQKFTADGRFIKTWGTFGQGETPESFYGPRGLAVDAKGRVYVTDTGNKRVVVFDADGNYLAQFGSAGFQPGQFDEPVGIAIDRNGYVYVADTWNQRVQVFLPVDVENILTFIPEKQWDVYAWFGQSLENKPFIAVDDNLHVFITDPEGYRVVEFDSEGAVVRTWGDYGSIAMTFGLASGIAVDADGHVWVTDSVFNRILRFTLP